MVRTTSILATAALAAVLVIGPTTASMARMENGQSSAGDASEIYVRDGGGGGGHGGGAHGGFGGGGHGFGGRGYSDDSGRGHFNGDRGFPRRRDFRGDFWIGDGYCYPGYYYYANDPYFCG